MAWDDHKAKAGYGRVFFDNEGGEHVGYAKTHNYVATSEQVFEYRKGIGMIEPYKGHGIRDEPILMPWCRSTPLSQPFEYSNVQGHVGYGQNHKVSTQNTNARDLNRFMVSDLSQGWPWCRLAIFDRSPGLPQNKDPTNPSWLVAHGQRKGLPQHQDTYESSQFRSPPLKDHYYNIHGHGKDSESSDDEDDVMCEDGVCYKKGGSKPINHLKQEDCDKEKHKGGNYAPIKDLYYEKPYDANEKHKGNNHVPFAYISPIIILPKKNPYYEPSTHNNNQPAVNSLKPIKTRPDPNFPNENLRSCPVSIGMQQPQYNESPRKHHDYDQSIHNKASHPARAYVGVIDAKEAAKKYKGYYHEEQ